VIRGARQFVSTRQHDRAAETHHGENAQKTKTRIEPKPKEPRLFERSSLNIALEDALGPVPGEAPVDVCRSGRSLQRTLLVSRMVNVPGYNTSKDIELEIPNAPDSFAASQPQPEGPPSIFTHLVGSQRNKHHRGQHPDQGRKANARRDDGPLSPSLD